jgi:hypothetical protein
MGELRLSLSSAGLKSASELLPIIQVLLALSLDCTAWLPSIDRSQHCNAFERLNSLRWVLYFRVGQNRKYTVYAQYFWQGNHQTYRQLQCVYTVLANPAYFFVTVIDLVVIWVLCCGTPQIKKHTHTDTIIVTVIWFEWFGMLQYFMN